MSNYDRRQDGTYLITGYKYNNKDIVIKMDSIINEIYLIEAFSRESFNLKWILQENENDDLLTLKGTVREEEFTFDLNKRLVIKQFYEMVKNNKSLEACHYLTTFMQKSFNSIFEYFLIEKGEILCSNIPVDAYIEIQSKGKVLGAASRFNFTSSNSLQLYEYAGKEIANTDDLTAYVVVNKTGIKFSAIRNNSSDLLFNPSEQRFGYLNIPARIAAFHQEEAEIEAPEIKSLSKVPLSFSTQENMELYIVSNNTPEEITAYKKSLKPRTKLININKFMLREFTI